VWGFLLFLIPLAILFVPFLVGMALPKASEATVTADIDALPNAVWRVLVDPKTSGAPVEPLGEGAWIEDLGLARIEVRTVEAAEPARLVRVLSDPSVPMRARWTIELESIEGRTRVRASNRTEVDRGTWRAPLYRFLMRLMNGPRRALIHYVRRLGGSLGARVQIDPGEQ